MPFNYQPSELLRFRDTLSEPRLSRYLTLTGSLRNAIEYYEWNSALGASLQVPLQSFEIALRNTFIRQLANAFGPHWYTPVTAMMDNHWQEQLDKTIGKLTKLKRLPICEADVVANTTFGYWVALLDRKHDQQLWKFHLQKGFKHPTAGFSRGELHKRTIRINQLRNRIAHHEPIFNHPLHEITVDLTATSQ